MSSDTTRLGAICLVVICGLLAACEDEYTQRCRSRSGWCDGARQFDCIPLSGNEGEGVRVVVTDCAPGVCYERGGSARCGVATHPGVQCQENRWCHEGDPVYCDEGLVVVSEVCGVDRACRQAGRRAECADDRPACRNDADDDRDGRVDLDDPGCVNAEDRQEGDEEECRNRWDDDRDGRIDMDDPGCTSPTDPAEDDEPACANTVDDDGDGRVDLDDVGCIDGDDDTEEDPPGPACDNTVDDDRDGLPDLLDPGCVWSGDDDESDPDGEPPRCANAVDDDEDGLIDWPDDPGCTGSGDPSEAQACIDRRPVPIAASAPPRRGGTTSAGRDGFRSSCGGYAAADAVYQYTLAAPATLVASVDGPDTDLDAAVSIRRSCDEPRTEIACGALTARVPDAAPGEYYVIVEGGASEVVIGSDEPIEMPPDPTGFEATADIGGRGWIDGGQDALDGYGRIILTTPGGRDRVDVNLGERAGAIGDFAFTVRSALHDGAWRIVIDHPVDGLETRPFDFMLDGDLGSDGDTSAERVPTSIGGARIEALRTRDDGPDDPPVTTLVVPGKRQSIADVNTRLDGDIVTVELLATRLPITVYVALSYADAREVVDALAADMIQTSTGPASGAFTLTISEE